MASSISTQDAQKFAHHHPAHHHDLAAETYWVVAFLTDNPAVAARYDSFVAAMVFGDQSPFRDAIATVSALAAPVWH